MSRKDKLIGRFLTVPPDFTWEELVLILKFYDYHEIKTGKTSESRRRFADQAQNVILLHKPHPANIVKKYVLRQLIENLEEKGKI